MATNFIQVGSRSWSPQTGFVTRQGAAIIEQQEMTERSRDYFSGNRGGVGASGITRGGSSRGGGLTPTTYAVSPLQAVKQSASTGKPIKLPEFPNTPAGKVQQSNYAAQIAKIQAGLQAKPLSASTLVVRRAIKESEEARQAVETTNVVVQNYQTVGTDLQQDYEALQKDASNVNVYDQGSVDAYNAKVADYTARVEDYVTQGVVVQQQVSQTQGIVARANVVGARATTVSTLYSGGVAPLVTVLPGRKVSGVSDTRSPLYPEAPPDIVGRSDSDTILTTETKTPFKSDFTGEPVEKFKTLGFADVASKGGLGSALLKESDSIDLTKEQYPLLAGVGKLGLTVIGIPASYAQAGTQYALKNINVGKGFKQSLEKDNPLLYQTIDTGINLTGGLMPRLLWADTGISSPLEGIQDKDFIYKSSRGYRDESTFLTQIYSPQKALKESGELIRTDPSGAFIKFGLDALDFVPFIAPIGIKLLGKTKFGQKALIKLGKYSPSINIPTPGIGKIKTTDVIGLEAGRGAKYLIDGVPSATKVIQPRGVNVWSVLKEDIFKIKIRKPLINEAPEGFGFVVSKFASDIKVPGGKRISLVGKPIPSQLATAEDTLKSISGTEQYIASVAPGKSPFKFSFKGQKIIVEEQPGASMLRSFSRVAQEGKLPSPEAGFFSATETIRKSEFWTFNKKKGVLEPFLLPQEKAGLKFLQESAKTKVVGKLQDFVPQKEFNLIESVAKGNKSLAIKGSAGEQLFTLKNLKPDDIDFISTNVRKNVDDFLRVGKEQGLNIEAKAAKYADTFNITIGGKPRIQISGVKKLGKNVDVGGIKVVVPEAGIVNKVSALNDPNVLFRHEKDLKRLQAIVDTKLSKKQILSKIDTEESIPQFYSYYAGKGNAIDLASENVKISFGKPKIVLGKTEIGRVPRSVVELPVTKKELLELESAFDLIRKKDAIVKAGGKVETYGQSAKDIDALLVKYGSKENLARYIRINRFESKMTGTVPGVGSLSGLRTEAEAIDLVGSKISRKASNIRGKVGQVFGTPDLTLKYDKTTDFGIYFRKEASASEKALIKKFNKNLEKSFLKDYGSKTVRTDNALLKSFKNLSKVGEDSPRIVYMSASALGGTVSAPITVAASALRMSVGSGRNVPKVNASISSGVSRVSSGVPSISASISSVSPSFSRISVPRVSASISSGSSVSSISKISSRSPSVSASLSSGSKSLSVSSASSSPSVVSSLSSGSSKVSSLSSASKVSSFKSILSSGSVSGVSSVSGGSPFVSTFSIVSPPPSTTSIIGPPSGTSIISPPPGTTSIASRLSTGSRSLTTPSPRFPKQSYKIPRVSGKGPRFSTRQPSYSTKHSLSQATYKTPKYKEEKMVQTTGYSGKNRYFEQSKFNSIKSLKNRTTLMGSKSRNDFRITNKFKDSNLVKKKYSKTKASFMNLYKDANKYNYVNKYDVSIKYKNYPAYKYSSKLVDKDVFNTKIRLKA